MSRPVRHTAFTSSHPAVPAAYLAFTLGFTMFGMQPVLIALSFLGGFLYGCCVRGVRSSLMGLRWQLPLIVIVALLNPLFSASGSTELFRLGERAVYLESLCYGLSMSGLFMASVLWFQAAGRLLSFDRVMALFGNAAPVVALMISMCMRLIPRFVRQGRAILSVQGAAIRALSTGRDAARSGLRASSVLMGWAMEDSLETADAMRARGWEAGTSRSTYTRFRFTAADGLALLAILVAGGLCAVLAHAATVQYAFYPVMSRLVPWWGYVPYAAWMMVPTLLHVLEGRRFT